MKMNTKFVLSPDEVRELTEVVKDAADRHDFETDEDTVTDMLAIVEEAMNHIGVHLLVDEEDEDSPEEEEVDDFGVPTDYWSEFDDDEEEEEDDDDDNTVYALTPYGKAIFRLMDCGLSANQALQIVDAIDEAFGFKM